MKSRNRAKHKGRKTTGTFTRVPHALQDCENWKRASHPAICLLLELARQYNGHNNGNLCASKSVLLPRGWSSPEVIGWAKRELLHFGFIVQTRQGGLHMGPNLYALTWHAIDDCKGKHDHPKTITASGEWKEPKPPFVRREKKRRRTTSSVAAPLRQAYQTH